MTAILGGDFREPAMMLWSPVFLSVAVIGVREGIAAGAAGRFALQTGTAIFAAAATAFGIGYRMGGAADWVVAAATSLALPALLRRPSKAADLQIGLAAALASGAKVEGLPLAASLVVVHLVRRFKQRAIGGWRGILRTVLPPTVVILPWLWTSLSHGFLVSTDPGLVDADRVVLLLRAFQKTLMLSEWHGFDLVALLVPPLLLLFRRLRPLAILAGLQLLTYCYIYLSAPGDIDFYVRSTLPRLLLHLLPVAITGASLAFAVSGANARARRREDPDHLAFARGSSAGFT